MKFDTQDMEQIVLLGLEYEVIEKEKAAERKALTRKNGLKIEDAKYNDGTTGQTRDMVAKKLGMSGRQWERMRFIYQHRDCLLEEEYSAWRTGKVSTSKQYKEVCEFIRYTETIDNMLDILHKIKIDIYAYEDSHTIMDIKRELKYALYPCRDKTKIEIMNCFDKLINYNKNVLDKYYEDIRWMDIRTRDLKQKLCCKTHNDI